MPEYKVKTLYSGTKMSTGSLCAHNFCKFCAVHCFVLAAKLIFQSGIWQGKMQYNYVHRHISGTQSVNTTAFCAGTQAPSVDSPLSNYTYAEPTDWLQV